MNREPTVVITTVISAIGGFLASIVKAAVLLGIFVWTPEQLAGITLVIDNGLLVAGAILTIVLVRDRVTPVASPQLPIGTVVNESSGAPTGVVVEAPQA